MDIEIPQAVEQAYRWPVSVAAIHSSVPIRCFGSDPLFWMTQKF